MRIIGILLVVFGIIALTVPSITFFTTERAVDGGFFTIDIQKPHTIVFNPIAGLVAVIAGIVVLATAHGPWPCEPDDRTRCAAVTGRGAGLRYAACRGTTHLWLMARTISMLPPITAPVTAPKQPPKNRNTPSDIAAVEFDSPPTTAPTTPRTIANTIASTTASFLATPATCGPF